VIPGEFEYTAPTDLDGVLRALAEDDGAKLLAGGMSLIPAMKHRLARPARLVDLGRVAELEGVSERRGTLRIGARATHADLLRSGELAAFPVVSETASGIGDVQVRNRGTFGGSLVHADPAADWPALFLALDGEARLVGPKGKRKVAASEFFTGMLTSAVGQGEVLTEVELRLERKRAGAAYRKLRQPASGFAVVGVAAQAVLDRKGRVDAVTVGVTGVNPVPFRARGVEERLRGQEPGVDAIRAACREVEEADPMDDPQASAEYRRQMLSVFAARALHAACERAAS
jgi:carbon-monoxide dehydrogenase medium subunit